MKNINAIKSINLVTLISVLFISLLYSLYKVENIALIVVAMLMISVYCVYKNTNLNSFYLLFVVLGLMFAPPTLVFELNIEFFGFKLLPLYFFGFVGFIFYIAKNNLNPVSLGYYLLAILFLTFDFIRLSNHGFSSNKIILLIFYIAVVFPYLLHVFRRSKSMLIVSKVVLRVILIFQFYHLFFLIFGFKDDFLWFDSDRWTRLGSGYVGDDFNPMRLYSIFWDPNYLIAIVVPFLMYIGSIDDKKYTNYLLIALISVLMTLSYQSYLIIFVCIFLAFKKIRDYVEIIYRSFLIFILLMPVFLMIYVGYVDDYALPDAYSSSFGERLHILWAVANSVSKNILGLGFGVFESLDKSVYFPIGSFRVIVAHGWLYEIIVAFGWIAYFIVIMFMYFATRRINKHGKIAFLCLLLWGLSSPALLTPYFWISLALILSVFRIENDIDTAANKISFNRYPVLN